MQISDYSNIKLSFSGHETFPVRYAWLTKAVQTLKTRESLFKDEDALVLLGVGKNMVSSIRYWSQAFGVLEAVGHGGTDQITNLGEKLLSENGWDPYLEDPGTLWLLHWNLVKSIEKASTWHLAFTRWNKEDFTKEELATWLHKISQDYPGKTSSINSINRDVDVFIRTYVPTEVSATKPLEETFDSPLVELGLIKQIDKYLYRFIKGYKPMLPDTIFMYTLLDFWLNTAPNQQTLTFETILYGAGSPGAAFALSSNALTDRLEHLPSWLGISFDDTAGMKQLIRHQNELTPLEALTHYYEGSK